MPASDCMSDVVRGGWAYQSSSLDFCPAHFRPWAAATVTAVPAICAIRPRPHLACAFPYRTEPPVRACDYLTRSVPDRTDPSSLPRAPAAMSPILRLASLASLAALALATPIELARRACAEPVLLKTLVLNGVQLQTFGCPALTPALALQPDSHPTTNTVTSTATVKKTTTVVTTVSSTTTETVTPTPSPTPPARNVCGLIGNTFCGTLTSLPPITDDCNEIVNSLTIFASELGTTYTVSPGGSQVLTSNTCSFSFVNKDTVTLEACWQDLAQDGSEVATTCFPPTQPINTLAQYEAPDLTWVINVNHS
ncbi:hypothetical protein FA95DRAFT_688843 [Auriscalpium vulgare]|uniref:Uncharacterized protein n=1 Tax=Auriscalpium vulgare TaxID=40419 RepID=A0ACB8S1A2_9AGAM|nr:hypothetical protein FA95DRAFT_688843 [Auriscalpium vulgare]